MGAEDTVETECGEGCRARLFFADILKSLDGKPFECYKQGMGLPWAQTVNNLLPKQET